MKKRKKIFLDPKQTVLPIPPLGLFILPFGVAGKGGKCLRISFVFIIGKALS